MTEHPIIRFEDVRVGDTISAEVRDVTRSGTVATRGTFHLFTRERCTLAYTTDTIRLVDRPKPALPTEPGSVIYGTCVRDYTGRWNLFLDMDGEWISAEKIDGHYWHQPHHVTAWLPAEIREVEA